MKKVLFVVVVAIMAVACKKEESDTIRPTIESVTINGVASNEHEVNAGDVLNIAVNVTDNEALNQLKVNVHSADDGHNHEGEGGEVLEPNSGTWSESEIISVTGTSSTKTVSFTVPLTIAGHWHVEVQLIDKEGNEATEYITLVHVSNTNLPVFTITTTPAPVDYEIELAAGETLLLSGDVADPDGLVDIHIEMENEQTGEVFFEYEIPNVSGTTFSIAEIAIGPILQTGVYHLHIHAQDAQGFMGEWSSDVHVE